MAETEEKTTPSIPLTRLQKGAVRTPNRRVSDVLPSGNLWPDLPRRELDDLLDKEIVIEDHSFLSGRYGRFGVILCSFPGVEGRFTSACGGEVVCRKLEELKDGRHYPVLGTISYNQKYYDLT